MARTIASEFRAFGSLSTRWFQGLLLGKTVQPPTFGDPPPPAASAAVALTAATRKRTGSFLIQMEARDYRRRARRRWTNRHMRLPTLFIAAVLALPTAAAADPYLPPPGKAFAGVTGGYEAQS